MGEGRMHKPVKPVALIIMDGWGIREMTEANAVALANTPNYDTCLLYTSDAADE